MSDITEKFAALGDPTRFAIVERLMNDGAQPAGALLDVADISAPAISRHLKVLRESGVIRQTVDKQRRIYSVNPTAMGAINDWVISHEDFWKTSLERLAAILEEDK